MNETAKLNCIHCGKVIDTPHLECAAKTNISTPTEKSKDLRTEIETRLEYALTSGENLEYAVNSIEEFIKELRSDNIKKIERLKKESGGLEIIYLANRTGFNQALDEVIEILKD